MIFNNIHNIHSYLHSFLNFMRNRSQKLILLKKQFDSDFSIF